MKKVYSRRRVISLDLFVQHKKLKNIRKTNIVDRKNGKTFTMYCLRWKKNRITLLNPTVGLGRNNLPIWNMSMKGNYTGPSLFLNSTTRAGGIFHIKHCSARWQELIYFQPHHNCSRSYEQTPGTLEGNWAAGQRGASLTFSVWKKIQRLINDRQTVCTISVMTGCISDSN